MSDENKFNPYYFEGDTMESLYHSMEEWQKTALKRLLSTGIQKDRSKFCCIALSNPSEVVICSSGSFNDDKAYVGNGYLYVNMKKSPY